jgi:hypothetical protein
MSLTIDATPGGAASNSYVTLADAETYFTTRPFAAAWNAQTGTPGDELKKQALIFATQYLDRQKWLGNKGMTTVAGYTQALAWPRRWAPTLEFDQQPDYLTEYFIDITIAYYSSLTIPGPIMKGTCELALIVLAAGAVDPFTSDNRRVKRSNIGGAVDTEYFASQDFIRGIGHFPHVAQIVAPLLRNGSGLEVERV